MSKRLKIEDLTVLKTGNSFVIGEDSGIFSPTFGLDSNTDEAVLNIYDSTGGLLTTTYPTINTENGLVINPGLDLRNAGFFTGIYKVRYNFLRSEAGDKSSVLIRPSQDNIIYTGDPRITGIPTNAYWVNDDGRIYVGAEGDIENPEELALKEYKYYVQEISPSRTEVRLSTLPINNDAYLLDFFELDPGIGHFQPVHINGSGKLKLLTDEKNASWIYDVRDDTDPGFTIGMVGATIIITNAYPLTILDETLYIPYIAKIVEVTNRNTIKTDRSWYEGAVAFNNVSKETYDELLRDRGIDPTEHPWPGPGVSENLTANTPGYPFEAWSVFTEEKRDKRILNTLLNFGGDKLVLTTNVKRDTSTIREYPYSIVYKLYEPLPADIVEADLCYVVAEMVPYHDETVKLIEFVNDDITGTLLRSPNFDAVEMPVTTLETNYNTYNDLVSSNTYIQEQIENEFISGSVSSGINIDYSNYNNFVNFGSIEHRIKNFYTKLVNIGEYTDQSASYATTNVPTTSSITTEIQNWEQKRRNEINSFDPFEKYMYFESGSYISSSVGEFFDNTWPKTNTSKPYILEATGSTVGQTWYLEQIVSASAYDKNNINRLYNNLPSHVREDTANSDFNKFIDMTGHYFDGIWTYAKSMTDIYDHNDKLTVGIAKDLLSDVAKSFGLNLEDGTTLVDLPRFALGYENTGSTSDYSTYSETAGRDISREIWSRIINNMPFFLKTKGTIRAIEGLLNCYGIPATILRVKEYGGPDVPNQLAYQISRKFTKALDFKGGQYVATTWIEDQKSTRVPETIEFRFKTATGSNQILAQQGNDWAIRAKDNGSIDNYGHISFMLSGSGGYKEISSSQVPIYDGEFFSVMLRRQLVASDTSSNVTGSVPVIPYNTSVLELTSGSLVNFPESGKIIVQNESGSELTLSYTNKNDFAGTLSGITGWQERQVKTVDTRNSIAGIATGSLVRPVLNISSEASQSDIKYDLQIKKYDATRSRIYIAAETSLLVSGSYSEASASYNTAFTTTGSMYIGGQSTHAFFGDQFSGSMMEFRYWNSPLIDSAFKNHTSAPKSYAGNHPSASWTDLVLRYSFDDNTNLSTSPDIRDTSADQSYIQTGSAIGFANEINFSSVEDENKTWVPNLGANRESQNKIRIEENKLLSAGGNRLHVDTRYEVSAYDLAPVDSKKASLNFAPSDVINEDIILSVANLDFNQYIGDPRDQFEMSYKDLFRVSSTYWQKYTAPNNFWDYLRLLKYYDHSLFKQAKKMIPARTKANFGILIEPNIFERSKEVVGKPPQITRIDHSGNIIVFGIENAAISMSGAESSLEGSASNAPFYTPSLYDLSDIPEYATSSVTVGGPNYVFKEGAQVFISGSRISEHNQIRVKSYSSISSHSIDNSYSSSWAATGFQSLAHDNSMFRAYYGTINTLDTTYDGLSPVTTDLTSPSVITTVSPGESELTVE